MVNEQKELSFQKLQKEIKDLIFLSQRRNVFTEVKDLVTSKVSLSLQDVIILYQAYLKDHFKEFHTAKEELERKLSSDLSYPARLSLSLVRDEWRQDIKTPKNMKKYWYRRKYNDCCRETVSINLFFNHQEQLLLEEVYFDHKHDSYLKSKNIEEVTNIYKKYKNDYKRIMNLYYKSISSISFVGKINASETEKSKLEIYVLPFYCSERKDVSVDPDITGEWTHDLHYYSEEFPINLFIKKVELFRLKPWNHYGNIFISFDLDYHLQDAFLYEGWNFFTNDISKLITKDSDSRLYPEIEFLISEAFPNFKIYLKDLPIFFSDYLEKYVGTDYLIEGKKQFDKGKEKERIKNLRIVDRTKQLVAHNNIKIVKLIKKNQKLYEELGERQSITKDILCKMIKDEDNGHWVIRPEFRDDLEYYDLSDISFDNVDVREVDFRNTNIKAPNFDPQMVYQKDLSGCSFESPIYSTNEVLFDYSTNFTDVNLESTTIKQETLVLYNNSIANARINQHTILPDELWKIRNEALRQIKTNIKNNYKL